MACYMTSAKSLFTEPNGSLIDRLAWDPQPRLMIAISPAKKHYLDRLAGSCTRVHFKWNNGIYALTCNFPSFLFGTILESIKFFDEFTEISYLSWNRD